MRRCILPLLLCLPFCFAACTAADVPAVTSTAEAVTTAVQTEVSAAETTLAVTAETTESIVTTAAVTVIPATTAVTTAATTATETTTTATTTAVAMTAATTTEATTVAMTAISQEPTVELVSELLSIEQLNTTGEEGDHAEDDVLRASLEMNYRQVSEVTGYPRFVGCEYPRLKKLADDFYILFYHRGVHLYYTTSADCMTWTEPVVFRDAAKFPMANGSGRYHAQGADAVLLDNGHLLVAYSVHPSVNYKTDMDNNGVYVRRGVLTPNGSIAWAKEVKVYTGQTWEPSFQLLEDGTIHLYFTQIAPYISKYGFDEEIRSSGTGMLTSTDYGYSWTPQILEGDTNYYRATTIFQQQNGTKTVTFNGKQITVPYFNGQMPQAVELVDGRTLLAVEIRSFADDYTISLATSNADGSWDALEFEEEGPDTMVKDLFVGAAPYLARFPSGEVYLTYHSRSTRYGKLGSADATVFGEGFSAVNGAIGSFGSCTLLGSHCVATVNPMRHVADDHSIMVVRSYLNHRVNAPKATVTVDGYTNDWAGNTDALFVGSESQAQVTLRTAHDDENVYFLFSRLDEYMVTRDYVSVSVGVSDTEYYTITVATNGMVTCHAYASGSLLRTVEGATAQVAVLGTLNDNSDIDEGALYEVSIPKSVLGLENAEQFVVALALSNTDTGNTVQDTMTNLQTKTTTNWPVVRLDP